MLNKLSNHSVSTRRFSFLFTFSFLVVNFETAAQSFKSDIMDHHLYLSVSIYKVSCVYMPSHIALK